MVETDSDSSVPPHIQPPMAQVPIAMRETFSDVPECRPAPCFPRESLLDEPSSHSLLRVASLRSPRCRRRQHRQEWRVFMRGPAPHTGVKRRAVPCFSLFVHAFHRLYSPVGLG